LIKGLTLTPDSFELKYNLGAVSFSLRDYSKSVRYFEAALTHAPNNAPAVYSLGMAYLGLKDRSASLTQHAKLRNLDPELATRLYKAINAARILVVK
jgi:tetratricopeptide (TPR) repeat protein